MSFLNGHFPDGPVVPEFTPRATQSVCPVCLRRVDAVYQETAPGLVELVKQCPEHGSFHAPIWRGGPALGTPAMASWKRPKTPSYPRQPFAPRDKGCPFDCGLCPEHGQHTCTGQIEVTGRCDLGCPVCYAESGAGAWADPPLERIAFQLERLWRASGACNVQLSGGEPTLRDDLPAIVAGARQRGFTFVQLNTNGLRLGRQPDYARTLAEAGLDSVYLQFDGPDDDVCRAIRGRPCLTDKLAAVRACAEAGLGVVLVATLVRGVNLDKVGALLQKALELGPAVRGLHLQPAASFGRFPWQLQAAPRVTLPEVMGALAAQSGGLLSVTDFHPPGCEHALCSFSAVYRRTPQGLILIEGEGNCCDASSREWRGHGTENAPATSSAEEGARISRAFTARHWSAAPVPAEAAADRSDDFDRFLARAGLARRFTVSCMAFQDALTLDVDRVRGCCIHVVTPEGLLVPFCLHNLTAVDGTPLYRRARPAGSAQTAAHAPENA